MAYIGKAKIIYNGVELKPENFGIIEEIKVYRDKLIKFMWKKNEILVENGFDFGYMKPEIEEAMRKWDEKECVDIFSKIEFAIFSFDCSGLGAVICPFCIKHSVSGSDIFPKCSICAYEKINGECSEKNSVFRKYFNYILQIEKILTNKVYRQILEEIEDE